MNGISTTLRLLIRNHRGPFIRYFFVGGAAFVVDYSLIFVLTEFVALHYLTSAALGFTAGLVVNYLLSILWVFERRKLQNKSMEFIIFSVIGVIGILMNHAIMWSCTDFLGFHYMVSKIFSQGIIFLFNYGARKFILF